MLIGRAVLAIVLLLSPAAAEGCANSGQRTLYFFTVGAVFKNEAVNLHEWISHYLLEGADHLFLTDNGSDDGFMAILQPFIDLGKVTLMVNTKKHSQDAILHNYILPLGSLTEWMLTVDLDEFVYARSGSISEFLRAVPCSIASILVPWKMYGSSGHKQHPSGSVVKNFVKRQAAAHIRQKAFFRPSAVSDLYVHNATVTGETVHMEVGSVCGSNLTCARAFALSPVERKEHYVKVLVGSSFLQLNHYPIQSLEWFVRTKMSRGDIQSNTSDKVRDFRYFDAYDLHSNELEDSDLYLKHKDFYDSVKHSTARNANASSTPRCAGHANANRRRTGPQDRRL